MYYYSCRMKHIFLHSRRCREQPVPPFGIISLIRGPGYSISYFLSLHFKKYGRGSWRVLYAELGMNAARISVFGLRSKDPALLQNPAPGLAL